MRARAEATPCGARERGSAPVEALLVGILLTVLVLGVLQLALILHVRNTLTDAAAEGARTAALADNTLAHGVHRTEQLIVAAIGEGYARDVTAGYGEYLGHPAVIVTVRAPLPLLGLWGFPDSVEVSGRAAQEVLG